MNDPANKRVIVLDTSAFLSGLDPFSINELQFTVPMVKSELTRTSMSRLRFDAAVESGKIRTRSPHETFVLQAKASAIIVGDKFFLSEVDMQVLALALELKSQGYDPLIATDDYSIQNVANQMQIRFAPLGTFGIRRRLHWIRYCPACHRNYPADFKSNVCTVCGTELKRKPINGSRLDT